MYEKLSVFKMFTGLNFKHSFLKKIYDFYNFIQNIFLQYYLLLIINNII